MITEKIYSPVGLHQLIDRVRRAMLRKIRWRSTGHHGCRSQTSGNKTGVIKLTKSDDAVHTLGNQINLAIGRAKYNLNIGIGSENLKSGMMTAGRA